MNKLSDRLEEVLFKYNSNPTDSTLLSIQGYENEMHELQLLGLIKIYSEEFEGKVTFLLEYKGEEYIREFKHCDKTDLQLLYEEASDIKNNFKIVEGGFKIIKGNDKFEKWRGKLKLLLVPTLTNPIHKEIYDKLNSFDGWTDSSLFNEIIGLLSAICESKTKIEGAVMGGKKIFIVHGRDQYVRDDVELFIRRIGLDPIILCNQVNGGLTIIEKIERYTDVNFAIVLYTSCDLGKYKDDSLLNPRARQNVVFEHGYLINKLTRKNVIALVSPGVETPGDLSGIVYISISDSDWKPKVMKELKNCNISFDWSEA